MAEEPEKRDLGYLRVSSWNIAAVNNNPFEYWVTSPDPEYDVLMERVQDFVNDPKRDVYLHEIFTEDMFKELAEEMSKCGFDSLDALGQFWEGEYKHRMAVKEFLKDKSIGVKRLSSMPDRITNTINARDGSVHTRPTAISAYQGGSLSSISDWWDQWKKFMFHTSLKVFDNSKEDTPQLICHMLTPILRSKYPAISLQEQEISIHLQLLCLAMLDAIYIYILNAASPASWESIRRTLCSALISDKAAKTCRVIVDAYADTHVFFLQAT